MAIPYIAARIVRLMEESGACAIVAYLGRTTVRARRTGIRHDYRRLEGDVVYEGVWLPDGAPAPFARPAALANAMEAAEPVKTRKERKRFPQPALSLIIALPPDGEVTLDEAIEIVDRVVTAIRAELRLAAYVAIHEPRLRKRTARSPNRHAHVVLTLRELTPDGFSRRKVRELVARVRTMAEAIRARGSVQRPYYVAEGVAWPDLAWSVQNRYFLEIGSALRVQPIAAVPQDHWPALTWSTDPEAIEDYLKDLAGQNRAFALGDELQLVTALMRGRSTLLLQDLRAFLERCLDDPTIRRNRVHAILAHPEIVECIASQQSAKPDRITTRAIHRLLTDAIGIVDRHLNDRSEKLRAARGGSPEEVIGAVEDALGGWVVDRHDPDDPRGRGPDVVLTGDRLSHVDTREWIDDISLTVRRTALAEELKTGLASWGPGTLVVLPRAEVVSDLDLARVVLAVDRCGARLLLGVDESRADGVVDHRLAVEIAARLTAPSRNDETALPEENRRAHVRRAERLLRAGFVAEAVGLMDGAGLLRFQSKPPGAGREQAIAGPYAVRVIDDPRLRRTINEAHHEAAIRVDWGEQIARGKCAKPPIPFFVGEPVVIGKTDYRVVPPRLREGTVAQVAAVNSEIREVTLQLENSAAMMIRGDALADLRPAYALAIREARALVASGMPTIIEVTCASTAWAALLLASRMDGNAMVAVSPAVATQAPELAAAVELALPSALPSSFEIRASPEARAAKDFDDLVEQLSSSLPASPPAHEQPRRSPSPEISDLPTPRRPARVKSSSYTLPVNVRDLISKDLAGQGFTLLRTGLADPRQAKILLARIESQGSPGLQALAQILMPVAARAGRRSNFDADEDLPRSLEGLASIALSDWELHRLKVDLESMTIEQFGWGLHEPRPPQPKGSGRKPKR